MQQILERVQQHLNENTAVEAEDIQALVDFPEQLLQEMISLRADYIAERDKETYNTVRFWRKHDKVYVMDAVIGILKDKINQ